MARSVRPATRCSVRKKKRLHLGVEPHCCSDGPRSVPRAVRSSAVCLIAAAPCVAVSCLRVRVSTANQAVQRSSEQVGQQVERIADAARHEQGGGVFPEQRATEDECERGGGASDHAVGLDEREEQIDVREEGDAAEEVVEVVFQKKCDRRRGARFDPRTRRVTEQQRLGDKLVEGVDPQRDGKNEGVGAPVRP